MFVPRDRQRNGYIKTWVTWIRGVLGYESGLVATGSTLTGGEPFRVKSYFTAEFRVPSEFKAEFRKSSQFAASFRARSVL